MNQVGVQELHQHQRTQEQQQYPNEQYYFFPPNAPNSTTELKITATGQLQSTPRLEVQGHWRKSWQRARRSQSERRHHRQISDNNNNSLPVAARQVFAAQQQQQHAELSQRQPYEQSESDEQWLRRVGASDNNQEAAAKGGGHERQLSSPASDACERMRVPALYRPDQGQAAGSGCCIAPAAAGAGAALATPVGQPMALKLAPQQANNNKQGNSNSSKSKQPQAWPPPPQQPQQQQVVVVPMAVAPPPICGGSLLNSGQLGMASHCSALNCDEAEESDCSCSNSLDCLASRQQQLSPNLDSQRSQPLLVAHHHHHHHQAHQLHQAHHQHQQHHQQHHHHHHHQHHHLDEECAFIETNHRPRQQTFQHHHRPLMANSSVPPLSSSTAPSPPRQQPPSAPTQQTSAVPSQAALLQPLQPLQPPPLVRQTTYTATADTITDSSLLGGPQIPLTPPPAPGAASTSDFSHPANEWQRSSAQANYRAASSTLAAASRATSMHDQQQQQAQLEQLQQQPLGHQKAALKLHATSSGNSAVATAASAASKQRQAVSFRRSATSVANAANNGESHRQRATSGVMSSATGNARANPGQQMIAMMTTDTGQPASDPANRGGQQGNNPHQLQQQHAICPSSPLTGSVAHSQHQHHLGSFAASGAHYPAPNSPLHTRSSQSLRGNHLLAGHNFDATFSLPPITSHRTNSPWMRISSIILTPIGIVIILFIVVSPLLHYLM